MKKTNEEKPFRLSKVGLPVLGGIAIVTILLFLKPNFNKEVISKQQHEVVSPAVLVHTDSSGASVTAGIQTNDPLVIVERPASATFVTTVTSNGMPQVVTEQSVRERQAARSLATKN